MTDLLLSNDDLGRLRSISKRVGKPGARWLEKPGGNKQRTFRAIAESGEIYVIYQRQNLNDDADFSCGLALVRRGRGLLSLVRYNGANHVHRGIRYRCHIHFATAEALAAGEKIDSHAVETGRYRTVEGALACLIDDCGVEGLAATHDERSLFDGA